MPRLNWDKPGILKALRRLHRQGQDLSYNQLARKDQALLSAAAHHFGAYRTAVEAAGIEYAQVMRRPRWTKEAIVRAIRAARRRGEGLHWSAATAGGAALARAAFAALQPRLFGSWSAPFGAAGLDLGDIARYRRWDRPAIVSALKDRARARRPLNSGAVQRDDPGLHAAALRHFGGYDQALRAAGLDPAALRKRRRKASR